MEIRIENLRKSYGGRTVFVNLNCTFPGSRACCVLGPSGCGKTTLLRLIAGLEAPDSGAISGAAGRRIGMVFQEDRLFLELSAERNVLLTARPGFSHGDARALLCELGLDARSGPVRAYSGGMRRRVALARALASDFELLLLDEPFAGLDDAACIRSIEVIRARAAGRTILCATHGADDARALGAEVLRLGAEFGQALSDAPPAR